MVKQIVSTVPNWYPIKIVVANTLPMIEAMVKVAKIATTNFFVAMSITINASKVPLTTPVRAEVR